MSASRRKNGVFDDVQLLQIIRGKTDLDRAVRYLYHEYFDTVCALITFNKGTRQDAEDIFQEVVVNFLEVVQKERFRGDSSIKTFLVSMARHTWLNQLKKNNRAVEREVVFEKGRDHIETDVSEQLALLEHNKQLLATIEQLGEACQKILLLFYFEELPVKEILKHLHYENEQVVRNKKHKCLQQLAELVKTRLMITNPIKSKEKK